MTFRQWYHAYLFISILLNKEAKPFPFINAFNIRRGELAEKSDGPRKNGDGWV